MAEPGAEFVIQRYRSTNANLRTQLERIIRKAGLKPWPKLFHNLRATRQTELEETFPTHVVCEWLGNSPRSRPAELPASDRRSLRTGGQAKWRRMRRSGDGK